MALPPFAFSIHNFISSTGADAGFAAIIGLAVLVLLYFAHARETANLREEAELLTQRLQQAEARVAELSRVQPAAQQPALEQEHEIEDEGLLAPFAPVGTAAPALASATHALPLVWFEADDHAARGIEQPVAAPVAAMAMVGAAATAGASPTGASPAGAPPVTPPSWPPAPLSPAGSPAQPSPPPVAPSPPPVAPPPASSPAASPPPPEAQPAGAQPEEAPPAAPSPGSIDSPRHDQVPVSPVRGSVPRPATDAGGNGAGHQPSRAGASPEPAWTGPISASRNRPAGARVGSSLGQLPPLESPRTPRRSRVGRGVAVGLVALAAVAVAVVLFAITSDNPSNHQPATSRTNTPSAASSLAATAFKPSSVTVAVLNGTSTYQLAHRIGQKLAGFGYRQGTIATASSQTATATVVAYVRGTTGHVAATNRADALHVAQALGLRSSVVQPVDQSTLQVACPASAACTANVVVTVGADLASQ